MGNKLIIYIVRVRPMTGVASFLLFFLLFFVFFPRHPDRIIINIVHTKIGRMLEITLQSPQPSAARCYIGSI